METRKKLYSIALASVTLILFLILISSTASASDVQNAFSTITETKITTNGSANDPTIYDDKIVWQDSRNGFWDIYMYNLSTHKEIQITNDESMQDHPAIYGDRMVWTDWRNGNYENSSNSYIYIYDLSTHKETPIITSRSATTTAIYGDRIVWDGNRNGYSNIYMYNLSTHKETPITTSGSASTPAIYGDRIVWLDNRNGNGSNIYMYNISTHKETRITTHSAASDPAIYGDKIVWCDNRNEKFDIYMYNLSISKETRVTTSGTASTPAIYGDRIVWADWRNGNYCIYMYNCSTFIETQLTSNSEATSPVIIADSIAIYGDRIVWIDYRSGNPDIYMGTLSTRSLIADFFSSPISGNAPLNVTFTDKTKGTPTIWEWNFGDGDNSTQQNPTHIYSKAGTYTVKETAINAVGRNTVTKTNYIKVTNATAPVAAFIASPTSGKAPLSVKFTDKSTGSPIEWKWNFGDGSKIIDGNTSVYKNPTHVYSKAGTYTVKETAINAVGRNTVTKTNYITGK